MISSRSLHDVGIALNCPGTPPPFFAQEYGGHFGCPDLALKKGFSRGCDFLLIIPFLANGDGTEAGRDWLAEGCLVSSWQRWGYPSSSVPWLLGCTRSPVALPTHQNKPLHFSGTV